MRLDDDVTRGAFAGAVVAAVVVAALAIALFAFGPDDAPPPPSPPFPRVEFGTVVVVVDGVEVVSSCDGFGHRVYVTPDSDYTERGVAVAADPACVEADG